jgi:hypothetical protein
MKKVLLLSFLSFILFFTNVYGQSGFDRGIRSNQSGNSNCNGRWNDSDCWCVLADYTDPTSSCTGTASPQDGDIIYLRAGDVITVFQASFAYTTPASCTGGTCNKMGIVILAATDGSGGTAGGILSFDPNGAELVLPAGSGAYIYDGTVDADDGTLRCSNTGGGSCAASPQTFITVDGTAIWGGAGGSNATVTGGGNVGGGNNPLPVTLVSFSAKIAGSNVKLFWATASEYNNDKFEVLRSKDGREFEKIGEVKGSGTTSILTRYEYTDERPFKGVSYYRLKQIDTDGAFEYLPVVAVNTESTAEIKGIYPNPSEGTVFINYTYSNFAKAKVEIYDALGSKVHEEELKNYSGGDFQVAKGVQFKPGMYFVKILIDGTQTTEKLIVR